MKLYFHMVRFFLISLAAAFIVLCAGCTTTRENSTVTANSSGETCCVCAYNNDLACVDVRVKNTTPRTDYAGKTYYFCSDDCRKAFENKPQKYLAKAPGR